RSLAAVDRVQRPEGVPTRIGRRFPLPQERDETMNDIALESGATNTRGRFEQRRLLTSAAVGLSTFDQTPLGGEADAAARMRQTLKELRRGRLEGLSHRGGEEPRRLRARLAFPGVTQLPQSAHHCVLLRVAMLPVADVKAETIRRQRDAYRTKVLR